MLYLLLDWIQDVASPPGFGVFTFITVRSALAAVTSFFICVFIGKKIIRLLKRMQIEETFRDDVGLDNHYDKAGTPSMGGLIILLAIIFSTVMWAHPGNIYIWLILVVTIVLGGVGFVDDYIKIIRKNKEGLLGKFKIIGQVAVGALVGAVLYFYPDFQEYNTLSTIPFVKDANIDYAFLGEALGWAIYIPVCIFILTAVSNSVNLTDGLDGLASGTSAIAGLALGILAYVSGRVDYSGFLDILYLPGTGELTIYCAAMVGACFGFLWYNTYPAEVFMGDTGSLALGGGIGAVALMIHKELLLPILCGIFFVEALSVIIQTSYFKYTKRKYGVGRRFFKIAPLHHHFEKKGWAEPKIVVRFWIIAILLAIFTIITLKLR
ncbi:phospho-N-acetylmuramoyl-pentapeptide-transferase [Natronogracilivirga saccharolytica]|uniref:Phospho-N-acetylmuramoyl-pentapeptide-transferase n=1 Tax=Natronogracilivirga saccharolytica TaxID=2812953 RepID=A0A8J7UVF6_9BACT|nr:phospho-N-acetylmuramoyl-pentapeptide-transferase [Natronogracilivirga saccharolytica]MBP3193400.1 phospho-N-acetylmuramoyl-pentapeptide-transferase [Natronogracilivirga saccharolytica]